MKSKIAILTVFIISFGNLSVLAYDTSYNTLYDNAYEFASRYEFHDGDYEKSIERYSGVPYASGVETADDGKKFEFPIVYNDKDAVFIGSFELDMGEVNVSINGIDSQYASKCAIQNGVTLAPADLFREAECVVDFDENLYVTSISNEISTLEILPQWRGMRKDGADGYYIPLGAVARFIDDSVYIPIRVVAEELGMEVSWDVDTRTVIINGKKI